MSETLFFKCAKANPSLQIKSCKSAEFRQFGRIHDFKFQKIKEYLSTLPMPSQLGGETYIPEDHAIDKYVDECHYIRANLFGQVPCQIGSYVGQAYKLNALEYHKCSEILILTEAAVLLLASIWDLDNFTLNTSKMQAFFVEADSCIELYNTTLHFSPLAVTSRGIRQAVVQQQGTNTPKTEATQIICPEDELLLERNKWVICHEEATFLTDAGAKVGLLGENLSLVQVKD